MLEYIKYRTEFPNIDSPNGRYYKTPSGNFASITTILSKTAYKPALIAWKEKLGEQEAQKILERAGARGTILHDTIEKFLTEFPKPTISDARQFVNRNTFLEIESYLQVMIKEMMKQLIANKYQSIAQEFVVWDSELQIAGRCDNLGYWNGQLLIVDFKTSIKEKPIQYIKDYFIQATFYCKAHNMLFPNNIVNNYVIIVVNEKGTSQIFTGALNKYLPDLRHRVRMFHQLKEKELYHK